MFISADRKWKNKNYLPCTNPCHKMILMRMVLEVKCTSLHTDLL